jgi:DNA-directed RNA polymerase subunit RPC12/RpoP
MKKTIKHTTNIQRCPNNHDMTTSTVINTNNFLNARRGKDEIALKYCVTCGKPLITEEKISKFTMNVCPRCNYQVDSHWKYCPYCLPNTPTNPTKEELAIIKKEVATHNKK